MTQDSLVTLILQLSNLEQDLIRQRLKNSSLNAMQAKTLEFIHQHPSTNQRDLATYLMKPEATITHMIRSLEQKGYIYRESSPTNDREKQVFLTPLGTSEIIKLQALFADLENDFKAYLGEKNNQLLTQNLSQLKKHLRLTIKKGAS